MAKIEKEVEKLWVEVEALKRQMATVSEMLELSKEFGEAYLADPFQYAKDNLDKKIIDNLLRNQVISAPEIAVAIGLDPNKVRWQIGKRLKRMQKDSGKRAQQWLEYNPGKLSGPDGNPHFRSWWIKPENIMSVVKERYTHIWKEKEE